METLHNAEVAWSAMFQEAMARFGNYEKAYPQITDMLEDGERVTNMALVLGNPKVRLRLSGEHRKVDHFSAASYELGVRPRAITVGVPMEYIRYDKLAVVRNKIQRIPDVIPRHYAKLSWDALVAGFTTTCWDSQFFFDTDHPYYTDENNNAYFSNKLTQNLSDSSFEEALARLQSIRDIEDDDPLNPCDPANTYLFVSPQNRAVADAIVAPLSKTGGFNPNANKAKVVVIGALSRYPTYWYLWDASTGIKPLVLKVNRRMDELVVLDQAKDWPVFDTDEALIGVTGEHDVHYAHPYCIIGSKP